MKTNILFLLIILLLAPGVVVAQSQQLSKSLVLTHVTVIDTTGAPPKTDMTVVVTGNRITDIQKSRRVKLPRQAQVVDATGKYLIPGLWDMHVHVFGFSERVAPFLSMLIANGVTGVRDTGSSRPLAEVNRIRRDIGEGRMLGPRIFATGQILETKFTYPVFLNVSSEAEARHAVRSLKEQGADFIKVYDHLPREVYFAIVDESKKQGIPFVGHVPYSVTAREASDAGQKSIEHFTGVLLACSSEEEELQKQYDEALKEPDFSVSNLKGTRADIRSADTFNPQKCAELSRLFRHNGTWQCPTLVTERYALAYDAATMPKDWRLKYIPFDWRKNWSPENDRYTKGFTPDDVAGLKRFYRKLVQLVGIMRRDGVEFLAGTDVGRPYIFPGFSLHDELGLLVEGGLTPMEALQTATLNPAKFFNRLDSLGTVERGKLADLVLLEANPLEDIGNTRRIAAVVVNGRYMPKSELQKMLSDTEINAGKK